MDIKYFKVTFLYRGKREEVIVKGKDKGEVAVEAPKMHPQGKLIKIEEIPIPFSERIKYLQELVKSKLLRRKINLFAYISALRQLTVMLKAGLSLKDSLEEIGKYTEDPIISEMFLESANAIDSGKTLSEVFERYEPYIGGISVAMVRLGEETGDLVMALDSLSAMYEKMANNRKRMKKALRYPLITMGAIAFAFVFLVLFVVPKFKSIFEELHADLPLPTKILLFSEFILSNYGWAVALGLIGLGIFHSFMYKASLNYKKQTDAFVLKTYLIKDVVLYGSIQRFLMVLSSLVRSGIPLIDSIKIAKGILGNEILKEKIEHVERAINQGRGFAESIEETELLDFISLKMIEAGEKAGELDTMLGKAADYYEEKFDAVIENMQAAIEPIMMVLIGGLVLLIALGVFLPMWNLGQAVKNG